VGDLLATGRGTLPVAPFYTLPNEKDGDETPPSFHLTCTAVKHPRPISIME